MPIPPDPPREGDYSVEPFVCKRCGRCCLGEGFVSVSDEECCRIAGFLGISLDKFLSRYTRKASGFERWLVDGPGADRPCVFLKRDANGLASCRIEGDAKPEQCRTFPMKWRRDDAPEWCATMIEAQRDMEERGDGKA